MLLLLHFPLINSTLCLLFHYTFFVPAAMLKLIDFLNNLFITAKQNNVQKLND